MGESDENSLPDSFELLVQRCIAELEKKQPPPRRPFIYRIAGRLAARCATLCAALAHLSNRFS